MIELVNENNGQRKSFPEKVAHKILSDGVVYKLKDVKYWALPEDSEFIFKEGAIVVKAKKKEKKEKKEKVSSIES